MGKKISQFDPISSTITPDAEIPVIQGGMNYRFKLRNLKLLLDKTSVGLDKVDNTADKDKPVSDATQAALDKKANQTHTHAISDVKDLQTALDAKVNTSELTQEVTNIVNSLDIASDVIVPKLEW